MLLRNQWPIKFRIQLCNKSKRGCRKKKAKTTKLLNVKKLKKNAIKTKTKCYTSAERKESKIYEQRNLPSQFIFKMGKRREVDRNYYCQHPFLVIYFCCHESPSII